MIAVSMPRANIDPYTDSPTELPSVILLAQHALKPLAADFAGDPREPDRLNLRGKMNWFTIQVGNYSGRPTPAQIEWIDKFGAERDRLIATLDALEARTRSLESRHLR